MSQEFDRPLRKMLRFESVMRRRSNPGWPSHYHERIGEDGTVQRSAETLPVAKLQFVGRCRHCHEVHGDWWLMDKRQYPSKDHVMILCAKCHQVMAQTYADLNYTPLSGRHGH